MNNVSFKGVFWVKSPSKPISKDLTDLAGKRKFIYENFNEDHDNLYVLRPALDKRMQNYLIANNAKFTYYPTLSTYDQFCETKPQSVLDKIKDAPCLTADDIKENIKNKNAYFRYRGVIPSKCRHIMAFTDTNNIDIKSLKKLPSGEKIIVGSDDKMKALFSPIGKYGFCFVTVMPKNADDSAKYYAINQNGEIVHEYKSLESIKKFKKLHLGAINDFAQSHKQAEAEEEPAPKED